MTGEIDTGEIDTGEIDTGEIDTGEIDEVSVLRGDFFGRRGLVIFSFTLSRSVRGWCRWSVDKFPGGVESDVETHENHHVLLDSGGKTMTGKWPVVTNSLSF